MPKTIITDATAEERRVQQIEREDVRALYAELAQTREAFNRCRVVVARLHAVNRRLHDQLARMIT